jgi:hypothetical protein
MKMRRSRLKEKLKEAALKRKDRELAKEHGFNSQVIDSLIFLYHGDASYRDGQRTVFPSFSLSTVI